MNIFNKIIKNFIAFVAVVAVVPADDGIDKKIKIDIDQQMNT